MEAFKTYTAVAAYLDRPNVDTDLIIPKQFLKSVERAGFGKRLFNDLRYKPDGETEEETFILNFPRYRGAQTLVAGENFGCGSSREHAAWALEDYGFKTIVAPSFGDIFRNNSLKVGLLLIELSAPKARELMERIEKTPGYSLTVDLEKTTLKGSDGWETAFEVESWRREKLLAGLDEIDLTLSREAEIRAYEKERSASWEAALPPENLDSIYSR
ncbi:MAG: 3-isopropylmalate dehydratase small subunit [Deltaproteobacteria bacterium]|jgi:3-isopropylmalate/(R)-2-methylmalate dehydratase small subunit|nr:3-isopropylmalate dehydratase small subunit [Deltaproteobacteria bacterium]